VRKPEREGIIGKARVMYIPSLGHYRVCCARSKERKGMENEMGRELRRNVVRDVDIFR
jgi:hypothetical protein